MNNFVKNTLILIGKAFISIFISIVLFLWASFLSIIYFVSWIILKICLFITNRIKPSIINLYSAVFNIPINRFAKKSEQKVTQSDIGEIVDYLFEKETFIIDEVVEHFKYGKRHAEKIRNILEAIGVVFKDKDNKNTTTLIDGVSREEVLSILLENMENFN